MRKMPTSILVLLCLASFVCIPAVSIAQDFGDTELEFPVQEFEEFSPDRFDEGAAAAGAAAGILGMFVLLVELAIVVLMLAGLWKVFSKAGKPGWAAIIPIYNAIVMLEICGRPIWWILLLLIPCVNIVISLLISLDLAKSFGKDAAYGIGLWLLGFIFLPILGFGSSEYQGPAAA
jgi:hypothetical protein